MSTTLADARPPADLPIWARLRLMDQGVPFTNTTGWIAENGGCISVFTIHGGWHVLSRNNSKGSLT